MQRQEEQTRGAAKKRVVRKAHGLRLGTQGSRCMREGALCSREKGVPCVSDQVRHDGACL